MFNLSIEPFNQFSKNKKKPILKMASGGLSPLDDTLPTAEQAADYKKDKALRKQVQKMLQYERLRGSATGTGLDNFGIDPKKHPNYKGGEDIEAATDYVLDTYGSKLRVEDSAIAKGEALDFMYNSGKDPYAYGYQEYLRKYKPNDNSWKENGSNNWNDRKNTSGEDLMKMYDESVGKLSENERRILLNKGRDWYYQNIDQVEGKPNPAYEKTWFGRMWNMNDATDFNPKNPKFNPKPPKMILGGTPPLVESSVTPNPTGLEGLDDPYYGKGKQITGTTNAQPMTWNTTPATPATIINGSSMGLNQQNKLGLQMTSLDPTAMTGDTKEAKGQRNVAGLTNMAGNFGGMLMGVGGAMLNNMKGQSEQQSLDYLQYQNQGIQSMQDINRGGGLQNMRYGGKPMKYPMGGIVGSQLPQPVQTEKGEKVISNKGDIFDTKATKTHKQMDSNEITDLFPSDSYIISNRTKLSKAKADKIILGLNPLIYKEGGDKSKYKEIKLSDYFTKDEETLSELTDTLRKRFPTELSDLQKGNIFARKTSEENKSARSMILGELIRLNEDGKPKKSNNTEVAQFPKGGLAGSYQGGLPLGFINEFIKRSSYDPAMPYNPSPQVNPIGLGTNINPLPDISDNPSFTTDNQITGTKGSSLTYKQPDKPVFLPGNSPQPMFASIPKPNEYDSLIKYTQGQMDGLDGDFRRNARDNNSAFMSNLGGVLGGSMTALAGLIGQNPRVESPNLKTPDLPRQMDKSYFDYLAYQNNKNTNAVANAALSNTSDYSKAMNYITAAGGKAMEANSQLGAQAAQINLGLESQYQQAKNQVQNQQAMLDVNAKNETNKFINNLVGQSAGIGTNAINNIAALNNQRINYNAKNRSEKTSRYSTLINQMMMLRQLQKGMPISFGATTATATQ